MHARHQRRVCSSNSYLIITNCISSDAYCIYVLLYPQFFFQGLQSFFIDTQPVRSISFALAAKEDVKLHTDTIKSRRFNRYLHPRDAPSGRANDRTYSETTLTGQRVPSSLFILYCTISIALRINDLRAGCGVPQSKKSQSEDKAMTPIQDYMRQKHRRYLSQASLEKQRQLASRQKIQLALKSVNKAAKAALEYRGVVQITGNGNSAVSSITAEHPPRMLKVHSSSPFSDVTNQIQLESFDETSRALFSEKASVPDTIQDTKSSSVIGREEINRSLIPNGGATEQDQSSDSAEVPKSLLSPRRQWELEPLQNALKLFTDKFEPTLPSVQLQSDVQFRSTLREVAATMNIDTVQSLQSQVQPRPPIHSALDIILQQPSSECEVLSDGDAAIDADQIDTTRPKATSTFANHTHDSRAVQTDSVLKQNNDIESSRDDKVYTFEEDANGAAWIISAAKKRNQDDESVKAVLAPFASILYAQK